MKFIYCLDRKLFFLVQNKLNSSKMTAIMKFVSKLFDPVSYILFVSIFFLTIIYLDLPIKEVLLLFSISQIFSFGLKKIFARVRPYLSLDEAKLELKQPRDPYSFPSGHTVSSFMLAFMVCTKSVFLSIPLFVMAFTCAVSRVYLGVHYPSDVLGGASLSFFIYILVHFLLF